MKLSKSQQDVVDKMKEGWTIHGGCFMRDKRGILQKINTHTFYSLITKGIIKAVSNIFYNKAYETDYQLTEKYINNEG